MRHFRVMDWKRFYADELASPRGHETAMAAITRHARGDDAIKAGLRVGGIASFPHVILRDSADPIARVAQSILELGADRVVALGVLHGGTLPPAYRDLHAEMQGTTPRSEAAFRQLGGACVDRGASPTPFGNVDEGPVPALGEFMHEDAEALRGEFSLDHFLALLAAAARARGVRPPPVTRIYVMATRSPDGRFDTAAPLARDVRDLIDANTVCVATGDLVHVGNAYTPTPDVASVPTDAAVLAAMLAPRIDAMHQAALARRDFAAAWDAGTRLLSDQRHMLPVIADLVGPNATAELLSFRLADYSGIQGVPPPSFVAAALTLFRPDPARR